MTKEAKASNQIFLAPASIAPGMTFQTITGIGNYSPEVRIRIVDDSHLDYEVGSTRFAGTYTVIKDKALRVTLAGLVNSVIYYLITPQGLMSENRQILLNEPKIIELASRGFIKSAPDGTILRFTSPAYRDRTTEIVAGDPPAAKIATPQSELNASQKTISAPRPVAEPRALTRNRDESSDPSDEPSPSEITEKEGHVFNGPVVEPATTTSEEAR